MQERDDALIQHLTSEEKAQHLAKYQSRAEEMKQVRLAVDNLFQRRDDNLKRLVIAYGAAIGFNPRWAKLLDKTTHFSYASIDLLSNFYTLAGEEADEIKSWLRRGLKVLKERPALANKLRGVTDEEEAQLAAWEAQLRSLALNEYERLQEKQLVTERDSDKDLATYKAVIESAIFGKLSHAINRRGQDKLTIDWLDSLKKWNLAAIIERYDRGKKLCTGQTSLREYASQELSDLEQDKEVFFRKYELDEYYTDGEKVPERWTVSENKRNRRLAVKDTWIKLLAAFTQYVESDLANLTLPTKSGNLSQRQIALLYIYQGLPLDQAIATKVGKENGHKAVSSGRKIMTDHYHALRGSANNRIGLEDKRAIASMSKAIEGVIAHLSEDKRQQAKDELQVLKDKK